MKRFIRYLYEYEKNQKKRNVGFVKVEQDGKEAVVSVHGKGLCGKSNENISCYLIKLDNKTGNVMLIPAGELRIGMTSCGGNFCYTEELVKSGTQVPGPEADAWDRRAQSGEETDICGLGLGNLDGPFYMALWNEEMYGDLDISKAVVKMAGEAEVPETRPERKTQNTDKVENRIAESRDEDSKKKAPEEPRENDEMLSQNPRRQIMKIQRGEISILPRCEWKLANNNFLLHGYYNYRHLVLIDEGDKLKLGVPGIYHEQEARAAATFGFPEFIAETDVKVTLEPQERNEEQRFGYWCRQVRRPAR